MTARPVAGAVQDTVTEPSPLTTATVCGADGALVKIAQTKAALVAVAPALSVISTVTELKVCTGLVMVPVIRPELLIPRVAGPSWST